MNGKSGTLTPEDFKKLSTLATTYGEKVVAMKVAKVCTKSAAPLLHEFAGSAVAKAFNATGKRITDALGSGTTGSIPGSAFIDLSKLVNRYGAEIVVIKLAKIAKKANKASVASSLKGIFNAA
jgi:hypothetical protein